MDLLLQNDDCQMHVSAEHGGRIASLEIFGEELLVGPSENPLAWGSYPLAPWAGRLRNGRFLFGGREYRIAQTRHQHPLHGMVFRQTWNRVAENTLRCELAPEWPFDGFALQRFTLGGDTLTVRLELHATGAAFPASVGFHPWFRRHLKRGQPLALDCDASSCLPLDDDGLPAGKLLAATERSGDDCLTGLRRNPRIRWPGVLRLHLASSHPWWIVYTRPAHAVCVEPWTAPPDALNSQPVIVHPGTPLVLEMRLQWESDDGERGP